MQKISAMELLTLLHKTSNNKLNMSASEIRVLSVLITYINYELKNGYESWPSTSLIMEKTGLSDTTIERARKFLIKEGWVTVESGKSAGCANHYFIDADKIIKAHGGSSGRPVAATKEVVVKEQHKRNTTGLQQGRSKDKEVDLDWYDEENCPF